jgi:hypothetical protein
MALKVIARNNIETPDIKRAEAAKLTHTYENNVYEVGDKVMFARVRKNKVYLPTPDVLADTILTVKEVRIDKLSNNVIIQILQFNETEDNLYPAYEYKPIEE